MKRILCLLGFHDWLSIIFWKNPHEFIKKEEQECSTCKKRRFLFFDGLKLKRIKYDI